MTDEVWVVKWEYCVGSRDGETCGVVGVTRTEDAAFRLAKLDADSWHKGKDVIIRPAWDPESRGECSMNVHHDTGEEYNPEKADDWDIWYDVERYEVRE